MPGVVGGVSGACGALPNRGAAAVAAGCGGGGGGVAGGFIKLKKFIASPGDYEYEFADLDLYSFSPSRGRNQIQFRAS